MNLIWKTHALQLANMIKENHETQAHLYLEQLMLLPVDIQDKIIEDISNLAHCRSDAIAEIISHYTMLDVK